MNKLFLQAFMLIASFFGTWVVLNQIDWISIFKIEQLSKTAEEKLGDLYWDLFSRTGEEIKNEEITVPLNCILSKICVSNNIEPNTVNLHIVKSDEVNAFALPNRHLVVYTGLISASANEAEISGVISHEIAHIEMNHVMKKLINEVGLSVLMSMVGGNSGSEIIKETAKLLQSSAYDRNLEKEADSKAVEYLIKAEIRPKSFADFLYRFSEEESEVNQSVSWLSTHPDSKQRAEDILKVSKNKLKNIQPILNQGTWDNLKGNLKGL